MKKDIIADIFLQILQMDASDGNYKDNEKLHTVFRIVCESYQYLFLCESVLALWNMKSNYYKLPYNFLTFHSFLIWLEMKTLKTLDIKNHMILNNNTYNYWCSGKCNKYA